MCKKGELQAVFFDRDGTLGDTAKCVTPTDFIPFSCVKNVFNILKSKGVKVFIFTNQSCIARGKGGTYNFQKEFMAYGADDYFLCPHDEWDLCDCRKPRPGLLKVAQAKYNLDLTKCVVVGDRITDIECGRAVGAVSIMVKTGFGSENYEQHKHDQRLMVAEDIYAAAQMIIENYA